MILRPNDSEPLRAITYLAPAIPLGFFEAVTRHLSARLGRDIALTSETRSSGPMHGDRDPFKAGTADIGFLCSPSFLYLRAQARPSVELVPAGFVFRDARHTGEPVYFSEVVVRSEHPARSFEDLRGEVWGYNDECSLSGYFSALQELVEHGADEHFFRSWNRTGSHFASIRALLDGTIDGAAIDSVALRLLEESEPGLRRRLRKVTSFGPFPIQPIVVRSSLPPAVREGLAAALLDLPSSAALPYGLEACVRIDEGAFESERRALCALERLPDLERG